MPAPPHPPQRLLIVRPSALGDVARTVPCLVSLRRAYPEAEIDWLVDRRFADAVAGHPMLDRVVPFDRKDRASLRPLRRRLRAAGYGRVFDLQGLARSGLMSWVTRAGVRVGYANARELAWLAYNRRHRVEPTRHAADRMLALLEAEGIERVADFSLHVPAADRGFAAGSGLTDRSVCLAPTAQWGCKCWPIERYGELAGRLIEEDRADTVAVLATEAEWSRIGPAMTAALPRAAAGRVRYLPTAVGQMMDLIRQAALLVGNDSAPLHLAVGLGTPSVSLFGPTDPALVGPPPPSLFPDLAARHRVLRAPSAAGQTFNYRRHRDDNRLIAEIGLDEVWRAVREATGGP